MSRFWSRDEPAGHFTWEQGMRVMDTGMSVLATKTIEIRYGADEVQVTLHCRVQYDGPDHQDDKRNPAADRVVAAIRAQEDALNG